MLHATRPLLVDADREPVARAALLALALVRFVSLSSLVAFGAPEGLTGEMIDEWTAAGVLHRGTFRPDPLEPVEVPYVALTTFGAKLLAQATGRTVEGIAAARMKRTTQKRAHDVFVGELALSVIAAGRAHTIDLAGVETDDHKLAMSALAMDGMCLVRVPLQPDALVVTRAARGSAALVVEIDRGTVSRARMLQKMRGYLAWKKGGGAERDLTLRAARVLTVVPDERRLETLHAAALDANDGKRSGLLLFALQRDFTASDPERIVEPIARALGGDAVAPFAPRPT